MRKLIKNNYLVWIKTKFRLFRLNVTPGTILTPKVLSFTFGKKITCFINLHNKTLKKMLTNINLNIIKFPNRYLFNIYQHFSTKEQDLFIDDSVEFKPLKILPYDTGEKKSRTVIKKEVSLR